MISLITSATFGQTRQERTNAEQQIIKMREEKTQSFFIECSSILQNEANPSQARQAAATVANLSIMQETQSGYLWDKLQASAKGNFKDAILSVLIDPIRDIRRAAANVLFSFTQPQIVASICCIQIPRNEWEGIVQKISDNIAIDNPLIKEVSILTLGFICEKLKEKKGFVFGEHLQKTILSGILLGLKESNKQIIETSLKALRDGIGSMSDLLKSQEIRDYMINQIVDIIRTDEYKNMGLQIITEFAKGSYEVMGNYISGFITLTEPIVTKTSEQENCIQAIQFWETVATEYNLRVEDNPNVKNYISGADGEKIVSWMLQNLTVIEDDDENDCNDIIDSASKCLESIFEEESQKFEKLILEFTANTIGHQSWKFRQASIRAFAIFLIGIDDKRKQQLVNISLLELIALLNDSSKGVQYSAIKSINLITDECSEVFLKHPNFLDILKLIVQKISVSENFLKNSCKIIDNLCAVCNQNQDKTFEPLANDLIQVLFDTCLTANSSLHTINCCIMTIMNLISVSYNTHVCKKYIQFALDTFPKIKQLQSEKKVLLFSSFLTLIQTCLMSLRNETVEIETLSAIYALVTEHYSSINKVDSDGLYVVGALANFFSEQIRLVEDFWKYIEHSLAEYTQTHIFKAALSCICDFATHYGSALGDRIPKIMTILLDSLQKPEVSRQSKLDLIMCIGQMFLNCAPECSKFLDRTMHLMIVACQASIGMAVNELSYAESLRQNIIETFTCILHGLNDGKQPSQQLFPHIINVFDFIKVTCDKTCQPRLNYVTTCVLFMADSSRYYKQKLQSYVRQAWVYECLQVLKKYNKKGSLDKPINYAKSQF